MLWDNVFQTEERGGGYCGPALVGCTICRLGRACRVAVGEANLPCPAVLRPALTRLRKTLVGGTQGRAGPASQKLADPKCSLQRCFTTPPPAAAVAAAAPWEEELGVEEAWGAGAWGAAVWAAGVWAAEAGAVGAAGGARGRKHGLAAAGPTGVAGMRRGLMRSPGVSPAGSRAGQARRGAICPLPALGTGRPGAG